MCSEENNLLATVNIQNSVQLYHQVLLTYVHFIVTDPNWSALIFLMGFDSVMKSFAQGGRLYENRKNVLITIRQGGSWINILYNCLLFHRWQLHTLTEVVICYFFPVVCLVTLTNRISCRYKPLVGPVSPQSTTALQCSSVKKEVRLWNQSFCFGQLCMVSVGSD